jgi:hypothetical protein
MTVLVRPQKDSIESKGIFSYLEKVNREVQHSVLSPQMHTSYDVYTDNKTRKHYPWCLRIEQESLGERVAIAALFLVCVAIITLMGAL